MPGDRDRRTAHVPGSGTLVDPAVVARAAALLRAGEAIVVPTDTVYGLAALPSVPGSNRAACSR